MYIKIKKAKFHEFSLHTTYYKCVVYSFKSHKDTLNASRFEPAYLEVIGKDLCSATYMLWLT